MSIMPNPDVLLIYQARLTQLQGELATSFTKQNACWLWAAIALVLLAVLLGVSLLKRAVPFWFCLLPAAAAAPSLHRRMHYSGLTAKTLRLCSFYERGVERLTGAWPATGLTGEGYAADDHPYAQDLNVLGRSSLFGLLCTTRTELGRERLARFLLDQPTVSEIRARQAAIAELAPLTELRERIALIGKFAFEDSRGETFRSWLATPAICLPPLTVWLLRTCSAFSALALGVAMYQILPWNGALVSWNTLLALLPVLAATHIWLRVALRERLGWLVDRSRHMAAEVSPLCEALNILSARSFTSPEVRRLQTQAQAGETRLALKTLQRLTGSLRSVTGPHIDLLSRFLLVDLQLALAIYRWKASYGTMLAEWLDAWAEIDALNALAGYSYEHPENCLPVYNEHGQDDGARFDAEALRHPLLPNWKAIANDVSLGPECRLCIISGSNMAGKSTLLRAVGLNIVLAQSGASVPARRLTLSLSSLCASISVADSLARNESKFLAEIRRIRTTLDAARDHPPVLFLFDEFLGGTNSRDRRTASEQILIQLIRAGAYGVISTHDLALTEIAELSEIRGRNFHMSTGIESDPLAFDYLLKPGVYRGSNALAIARLAGVWI